MNLIKKILEKTIPGIIILSLSFSVLVTPRNLQASSTSEVGASIAVCLGTQFAATMAGAIVSKIGTLQTSPGAGTAGGTDPMEALSRFTSSNLWKECVLDPVINAAKNQMIDKILETILGKANSGRDGEASYVKNFGDYLRESYDEAAGAAIYNNKFLGQNLCEGFELPLKFYLQGALYGTGRDDATKCTLSQVKQNIKNAGQDTYNYYKWGNFYDITIDSGANTPFGIAFKTESNIQKEIGEENAKKMEDIARSSGFISFQKCDSRRSNTPNSEINHNEECKSKCPVDDYGEPNDDCIDACYTSLSFGEKKDHCEITTPGQLLQEGVNTALGTEISSLQLADEFDEIFSALMGALITKAFSKDGMASYSGLNHDNYNPSTDLMKKNLLSAMKKDPKADLIEKGKISVARAMMLAKAMDYIMGTGECWKERRGWEERGNYSATGAGCTISVDGETGNNTGPSNGYANTVRFSKNGAGYCGGSGGLCKVNIYCGNGSTEISFINPGIPANGAANPGGPGRYQEAGFLWKSVSESSHKLVILYGAEAATGDPVGDVVPGGSEISFQTSGAADENGNLNIGSDPRTIYNFSRLMESLRVAQANFWSDNANLALYKELKDAYEIAVKNVANVKAQLCLFNDAEYQKDLKDISSSNNMSDIFEFKNKYSGLVDSSQNKILTGNVSQEKNRAENVLNHDESEKGGSLRDSYMTCKAFETETAKINHDDYGIEYKSIFYDGDQLKVNFEDIYTIKKQGGKINLPLDTASVPDSDGEWMKMVTSEPGKYWTGCPKKINSNNNNNNNNGNVVDESEDIYNKDEEMKNFLKNIPAEKINLSEYTSFITTSSHFITPNPRPANANGRLLPSFKTFYLFDDEVNILNNKYLIWLKNTLDQNNELNSIYGLNIHADSFVNYNSSSIGKIVDTFSGNTRYCTMGKDKGWQKYRVFIPPHAKKYALLFKPEKQDDNILYRVHLTYLPVADMVDHTNVLPLKYVENDSEDEDHSTLDDLFLDGKTVLLNINNDNNKLISEREIGVSKAGLVLGESMLKKYITEQGDGGWLLINISQDSRSTGNYSALERKLYSLIYVDLDRENNIGYQKWAKDVSENTKKPFILPIQIDEKYRDCNYQDNNGLSLKEMDRYVYDNKKTFNGSQHKLISSSSVDNSGIFGSSDTEYDREYDEYDDTTFFQSINFQAVGDADGTATEGDSNSSKTKKCLSKCTLLGGDPASCTLTCGTYSLFKKPIKKLTKKIKKLF